MQSLLRKKKYDLTHYNARGFWSLIGMQFQGAFNDNLYRYLIIFYLLNLARLQKESMAPDATNMLGLDPNDVVPAMATVLFSIPFIILPGITGALADRYSKQQIALFTKYLEVGIMVFAGIAFYMQSIPFIWAIFFIMAIQSAIFSPAKYGILPEILPEHRLSWGNGILQMMTIVAIIAGMGLAGPLYMRFSDSIYLTSFFLIGCSLSGLILAHFITRPASANPEKTIPVFLWAGMGRYFVAIYSDRWLLLTIVGYVYFWFAGALVQQNILKLSDNVMAYSEDQTSVLLVAVSLGIGLGALACGFWSRGRIEVGLIPLGALGMTLAAGAVAIPAEWYQVCLDRIAVLLPTAITEPAFFPLSMMAAWGGYFWVLASLLFCLGFFAGVYDVPLAASLQQRAPDIMRGGILATTNMLTFVGIAFSGVLFLGLGFLGFTPFGIFLLIAVMSLAIGVFICMRLPFFVLRMILWFCNTVLLKLTVKGRDNIPEKGGALFVANHISFVDLLCIQAAIDRKLTVVVGSKVKRVSWMQRCLNMLDVIYVDEHADEHSLEIAVGEIKSAIARGSIVLINNEVRLAEEGSALPWFDDYGILIEDKETPVVPLCMSRLYQSLYTFEGNRLVWKKRGIHRYPVWIQVGEALGKETPAREVRENIVDMSQQIYSEKPTRHAMLHHAFIWAARKNLKRMAIADAISGELNYFKTLVGSIIFARKLKVILDDHPMTGVLLPPTVGGVLTNIALQMLGKTVINLNYTLNNEGIVACARQCELTQVLTSKKFLEKVPVDVPGETILLEDVRSAVTGKDRITAMILALLVPVGVLDRIFSGRKRTTEELATIIFSSGSEGDPKGVMLTHRNVLANIEASMEVFPHHKDSCIVGYLPIFHSFGHMATIWLPLTLGLRAIFHPNPLEPKVIGDLVQQYKGTIMIGTSTLLQGFIRRCSSEQLNSLEFVVCGAEKLAPRVRSAFKEKFGPEPLEGYGTTECSPVVALDIPDLESPGFYYHGTIHGTIGRLIPGLAARIVNPDTEEDLPPGESGLLLVKGPNIMQGYLNQPERTAKVLKDGWYCTGDIASIDDEGFITITDRLARFSKIAGEMVPHNVVEETLHAVLDLTEQCFAIASVPDSQKGERLVVLHTVDDEQLDLLFDKLDGVSLPNLWIPRKNSFYRIEAIPVLGTGKMDIKCIRMMARELEGLE